MVRGLLLVVLCFAASAAPARAGRRPLDLRTVRYAVAAWEARFGDAPYTVEKCRVGRRHGWCEVREGQVGCGCSPEEPAWSEWFVAVDIRGHRLRVGTFSTADVVWLPYRGVK